jgi:hypothetical protein
MLRLVMLVILLVLVVPLPAEAVRYTVEWDAIHDGWISGQPGYSHSVSSLVSSRYSFTGVPVDSDPSAAVAEYRLGPANGFTFTATFSWTEYADWDQTTVLQVHTRTATFDSMTIRLVNDIMYADGSVWDGWSMRASNASQSFMTCALVGCMEALDPPQAFASNGLIENLAMLPHGSEGFMNFGDVNVAWDILGSARLTISPDPLPVSAAVSVPESGTGVLVTLGLVTGLLSIVGTRCRHIGRRPRR